jgi:hypothetical protein
MRAAAGDKKGDRICVEERMAAVRRGAGPPDKHLNRQYLRGVAVLRVEHRGALEMRREHGIQS